MSESEAVSFFPFIIKFIQTYDKKPNPKSMDPYEVRLALASKIIKKLI